MLTIPDPGFAGDDGAAPAELVSVLADLDAGTAGYVDVLAVLQGSRLVVPVVALLGEVEYDEQGLAHDKTSDMATVLMRGHDDRLALLAFTGTESLGRWNPEARPVPADTRRVAAAALQDDAVAVVIDVAGPRPFVVQERDVRALAEGFRLVSTTDGPAWAKEEV